MFFDAVKVGVLILNVNLVSDNHGLTKIHVLWAYPSSLHYKLWFCVCLSVTDHIR